MKRFLRNNGLSVTFLLLFLFSICGQMVAGYHEYNKERKKEKNSPVVFTAYLRSGHFVQSTFENWESEFLQMALFIVLAIRLRQKGSSESKKIYRQEQVDRHPSRTRKNAPWPVKRGGWILKIYERSLTIAFLLLFTISFCLHLYGSMKDENEKLLSAGKPAVNMFEYLTGSRFWFESFQNWQSEFLSVFAIIVLSIYLRQKGSPQSKPVDAANNETGK